MPRRSLSSARRLSPTIPINRSSGGGDGAFGGDSTFAEETLPKNGTGASLEYATNHLNARGDSGTDEGDAGRAAEDENFTTIDKTLQGRGGESLVMENALKHVTTRTTDEGMVIELFDIEGSPLFNARTGKPEPILRELVSVITEASKIVVNQIAVEAHVRATPIVRAENPVWEKSAQRATETRLLLELFNVAPERIKRVAGYADREPAVEDPMAVRNNRLEIILLREGK